MKWILAILVVVSIQCGCSVGMALHGTPDPDLTVLRIGQTRGVVETQLGRPVSEFKHSDGNIYATYAYKTGNKPSPGRAIAHGVMDVLTLGLWEVVGTPVEYIASQTKEGAVVVVYDRHGAVVAMNEAARREESEVVLEEDG